MSGTRQIRDALLERYLAGDLDPAATAAVDDALRVSPADLERLAELRVDTAEFLVQNPPSSFLAVLRPGGARTRFSLFRRARATIVATLTRIFLSKG